MLTGCMFLDTSHVIQSDGYLLCSGSHDTHRCELTARHTTSLTICESMTPNLSISNVPSSAA